MTADSNTNAERNEIERALRESAALRELDEDSFKILRSIAKVESHAAGTLLFTEGETYSQVMFVCQGMVTLDMVAAHSEKLPLLTVGSGDLLAWSALFSDKAMTTSATVKEELRAIVFDADQLLETLQRNSKAGYQVMYAISKSLSKRLLATRLQLLDLYS